MAYNKNTAGQFCYFQGVDATTGGIKSGVTWTIRRCIDGTFAAGGGTVTEDGTTGWYKYAMAQADTNGTDLGFNFTGTGAVPQTVNCTTDGGTPNVNAANIGGTAQTGLDLGANWTAARAAHLDADISSRMATFSLPANFAATSISVGGVVAASGNWSIAGDAMTLTAAYNAAKTASQAGDAMALTGGERTSLAGVINTTAITESYRANGAAPTPAQVYCEILAHLGEMSITNTTLTLKKFDHSTTAETYTLNDANTPSAVTRAT